MCAGLPFASEDALVDESESGPNAAMVDVGEPGAAGLCESEPDPWALCFCDFAHRRPQALQSVLLPFGPLRHLQSTHSSVTGSSGRGNKVDVLGRISPSAVLADPVGIRGGRRAGLG